jgi:hypothetical protein
MKIPDEIRKTVGFITYENKISGEITPVGTSFFLGHNPGEGKTTSPKVYAVTARHVVDEMRKKGVKELILRLNSKGGLLNVYVSIDKWFVHPSDRSIDVAIHEMGIPANADHLVLPFNLCVSEKVLREQEVELGDEVFISGLFQHHFGAGRNLPIIRVGNLAAMNEERIETKDFGEMDGYLIEARSIGGLSGSPVFLNLGVIRIIGGKTKFVNSAKIFLLGLIHGHYDVGLNGGNEESVNAGIAIVVPIQSVMSVIEEYEKRESKEKKASGSADRPRG